jgi:vancomycin aglycone glucosyltransferase
VRVLLSTYDSRGGVEPLVGLAVRLRELGAPPVCVGFGSMRAREDIARGAIEAIRAQGRRALVAAGPTWR